MYISLGLSLLHCQGKSSNPPSSDAAHLTKNPTVLVDCATFSEVLVAQTSSVASTTTVAEVSLVGETSLSLVSSPSVVDTTTAIISDTGVVMAGNTATDTSSSISTNSTVLGNPISISGIASIDWSDTYPLTLQFVLTGTQTQTFTTVSGGAAMSIPFPLTGAFEGQTYGLQNVDSLEVTCASSPSGTVSSTGGALSLSCTKTLVGKVLSAVRTGDNSTLSKILSADTTGVVASMIPSVGIYAAAPVFSPGNTTVYL